MVFRGCKDSVMKRSDRNTEYFDVSFFVVRDEGETFRPDDIRFERGTVNLLAEETECILDNFRAMRTQLDAAQVNVPTARIRFVFCFNNRSEN